jgi:hypothetical protein
MEEKTDLIENNNLKLELLNIKCTSKRLKREFISMYKLYDEVFVELIPNSNEFNVIVYEFIDNKRVCYKFVIGINYPFVAPTIFLNYRTYRNFLFNKTSYEAIHLKKLKGINCLCCHSLTCTSNWSPRHTLTNIIDEIKYYKKIKKHLVLKIMMDIIKRKYLIDDIDLASWLF